MSRKLITNPETLDLYFAKLEDDSLVLDDRQQERFDRLSDGYYHWLSNPMLPETRMRDYLMSRHGVTSRIAYQDIAVIKAIFGHVPMAHKEQMRIKANHLFDMAAAAAMAGNDAKARALTKIAEGIAKVNHLDENEGEENNWEDIVPRDFSLSVDPRVIGIEPVPGILDKAQKLLRRYTQDVDGEDMPELQDGD